MKRRKISFLIAAHNEEKIISKPLANLLKLPYDNYEVILGLDGCTDNTEKIVKEFCNKSKKIKYYKLNLRQGKTAVINRIMKKAGGEIIVVHDADWIFKVRSKKDLEKFFSVFDNPKIGGIAEAFPVEWDEEKIKNGNLGYRMVAYSSYFWIEFQKKRFSYKENGLIYLKEPVMFLTDVFRKRLYKENTFLCDDIERTNCIMNSKYKVVMFGDENMPRMIAAYDNISVAKLFEQKIRTAIARKQLESYGKSVNKKKFYFPLVWYLFKNSFKAGINVGFLVSWWLLLTYTAEIASKFKRLDTKKGWMLRARR